MIILRRMGNYLRGRLRAGGSDREVGEREHILAVSCTGHGASLAYLGRDGTVRSSVLDRWAGTKGTLMLARDEDRELREGKSSMDRSVRDTLIYGFGRFPDTRIFEDAILPWTEWLLSDTGVGPDDIDLLAVGRSDFATNSWQLGRQLDRWFPGARMLSLLEHHEVHQRQAFWQSGFEEAAVLTLDTCGERLLRLSGRKLSGTISRFDRDGRCEVLSEHIFPRSSAGYYYDQITHHVGFSVQHGQGKTMGLAPYGSPMLFERTRHELKLRPDGSFRYLKPQELEDVLADHVPRRNFGEDLQERHGDVAFLGQALLERIVVNAFAAAKELSGLDDLAYSGGVALNCVANEVARREVRPRRLYVAPNPGDTGQALGSALWAAHEVAGWPPTRRETAEYLGPDYPDAELASAAQASGLPWCRPDSISEIAAACLAEGHVLARFSGRAEHGPRALGHRSILADPRRALLKDHLNAKVKFRESFRPFAPSVLLEHAGEWFHLDDRSPYMLRVVQVREEKRDRIPAVLHVDDSARLQTVSRDEAPGYHELIQAFFELTGVPLVLNTSFNVAGQPIVETPAMALESFRAMAVDLLILGPYLLSKRPLEAYLPGSGS